MEKMTEGYDFEAVEDQDGVRLPWNCFPTSNLSKSQLQVPLSCHYTPLNDKEDLVVIYDNPIMAAAPVNTILNPCCNLDYSNGVWTCPISLTRNKLSPQILNDKETLNKIMNNTTIEYSLAKQVPFPQIYLIIIDTSCDTENLESLKQTVIASLNILPENALIGFMTFGKHVHLYELNESNNSSLVTHVFNGDVHYSQSQVRSMLGLLASELKSPKIGVDLNNYTGAKYFQPLQFCEFQLELIFDNLIEDSFLFKEKIERRLRCTGEALNVAVNLLESCFPRTGAEIFAFASGPCNYGKSGKITTPYLKDYLRSHKDIQKKNKNYCMASQFYYEELAQRASKQGYITNFFIGCFDQVGLFEMTSLSDKSGGTIVFSDSFQTSIFKNSFLKFVQNQNTQEERGDELDENGFPLDNSADIFENDYESTIDNVTNYGVNGSLEIRTSRCLKIEGLIGHATSLKKNGVNVSEHQKGLGGTNSWKLSKILNQSTYTIYFDISKASNDDKDVYIQFLFYYQHPSGNFRLRVTTIRRPIFDLSTYKMKFINAFDEEAAVVAITREVSWKIFKEVCEPDKVRQELDELLIKFMKNFANINYKAINKLEVSKSFTMFPQFIYNLRRSFILRLFNYSPDELIYYNHTLLHEDVNNSLIMIQPVLISYEQDEQDPSKTIIEPVLLDSVSVQPKRILLLDSFFEVVIFHGEIIAAWKKQGYQDDPEYIHFKNFLQLPREEVANILANRFPLPRYVDCEAGDSQSRFLYTKLNPTNSYNKNSANGYMGAVLLTDDISLQIYIEEITQKVLEKK